MACSRSLVRALDVSGKHFIIQHHGVDHAGGCEAMPEVTIGWTSGATVRDYDATSKI